MLQISAQQEGPHPLELGIRLFQAQLHRHRPPESRLSRQLRLWLLLLHRTVALSGECHTRVQPVQSDARLWWSSQSQFPSCSWRCSWLIFEWIISWEYRGFIDGRVMGWARSPALVLADFAEEASSVLVAYDALRGRQFQEGNIVRPYIVDGLALGCIWFIWAEELGFGRIFLINIIVVLNFNVTKDQLDYAKDLVSIWIMSKFSETNTPSSTSSKWISLQACWNTSLSETSTPFWYRRVRG